jgi:hypothetical protein
VSWEIDNRRFLTDSLGRIQTALEAHAARLEGNDAPHHPHPHPVPWTAGERPPMLDVLSDAFELSPFERDVLLLCTGMELDGSFGWLCARAGGDPRCAFPTFGLAMAVLHDSHWDAVAPSATLRHWDLVDVEPGPVLTQARLRVPPRVWQFLLGIDVLDDRLARYLSPIEDAIVSPSQDKVAQHAALTAAQPSSQSRPPVIQLAGRSRASVTAVAIRVAEHLDVAPLRIPAEALPSAPDELDHLGRILRRESILRPCALILDGFDADAGDAARGPVLRLISMVRSFVVVTGRERRAMGAARAVSFEVDSPTYAEQRARWIEVITDLLDGGEAAPVAWAEPAADVLACQFDLDFETIRTAATRAAAHVALTGDASPDAYRLALWDACRGESRPQLEDLARRIDAAVDWSDLVLPDAQLRVLRDVEVVVKRRAVVDAWMGASARSARGLGTAVLFAGPSGTGKTLAAEVLANRLRLDLYRIDLSAVVSKYIGETEKNLRRLFDAAENGGSILLFDEADALFAKRSDVKDSHDRYANVEVGYLLQRLEVFRGLAILTTNMKATIDQAFLRRLRFIVDFPFPDEKHRALIWSHAFASGVPVADLDVARLARLNVSGASIRNIALHAAYLAADETTQNPAAAVRMSHLLVAARREYEKLQQPLTSSETRGWE